MNLVVLDTNVLVSALLLKGRLKRLVDLWKTGAIHPVITRETFSELMEVLAYPKFNLSETELRAIVEDEILPFFEVIAIERHVSGTCTDPEDDIFLAAAVNARASIIVTGDKALLDLKRFESVRIVSPREYLDAL